MKKLLILSALLISQIMITDEHCLEFFRRTKLQSNPMQKVKKPCYCNCSQALAKLGKKQYQGRCPICKHFHVPSEIKYTNKLSLLR